MEQQLNSVADALSADPRLTRRDFLRGLFVGGAVLATASLLPSESGAGEIDAAKVKALAQQLKESAQARETSAQAHFRKASAFEAEAAEIGDQIDALSKTKISWKKNKK